MFASQFNNLKGYACSPPDDNAFNGADLRSLEIHLSTNITTLSLAPTIFRNNNIFQERATERIPNEETNTMARNMQCE
jgi:hypothetical protein